MDNNIVYMRKETESSRKLKCHFHDNLTMLFDMMLTTLYKLALDDPKLCAEIHETMLKRGLFEGWDPDKMPEYAVRMGKELREEFGLSESETVPFETLYYYVFGKMEE